MKNNKTYPGQHLLTLRLRHYKPCDAKYIVQWIKSETELRKWSSDKFGDFPITEDDINKKYIDNNGDCLEEDNFYQMTAFDENGIVGHLIMRFTDEKKSVLRFGFVITDPSRRGQGFGKAMILLSVKYAFEIFKAEKITIGVFENNPSAYFCYKSAGFKDIPSKTPEYYTIMGEQWKCLEMEINKNDYNI